jgi:hypothetical protein
VSGLGEARVCWDAPEPSVPRLWFAAVKALDHSRLLTTQALDQRQTGSIPRDAITTCCSGTSTGTSSETARSIGSSPASIDCALRVGRVQYRHRGVQNLPKSEKCAPMIDFPHRCTRPPESQEQRSCIPPPAASSSGIATPMTQFVAAVPRGQV